MSETVLRAVVRRETHSPRTVAMIVAVVVVILALAYVGTEIVLWMIGLDPLLISPGAALAALVALPGVTMPGVAIAIGAVAAILGLVLVVLALAPGRLSKHRMSWGERAVVVDNGVVASSLAQHLSDETGVARDRIVVGVAHRTVDVTVRPPDGVPVDSDRIRKIVEDEVDSYQLAPRVTTRVKVQRPVEKGNDR